MKFRRNKFGAITPMTQYGHARGDEWVKENIFNTEVVRSLKHYDYFAYKISDVMGSRFTETKPCDILICSPKGVFIAAESKQIKKWSGLTGKMLRDNQIKTLDKTVKNKGKAFVLLNIRLPLIKGKQQKENWCVVFNWAVHRKAIMGNEYTAEVLRGGYIGEWRLSSLDENKKTIWDIKDLDAL